MAFLNNNILRIRIVLPKFIIFIIKYSFYTVEEVYYLLK